MITVQDVDDWRDEQLAEIWELEALADLKELEIEGDHGKESRPQDHPAGQGRSSPGRPPGGNGTPGADSPGDIGPGAGRQPGAQGATFLRLGGD